MSSNPYGALRVLSVLILGIIYYKVVCLNTIDKHSN